MRIETNQLYLDLVEIKDAEFILKLRNNSELNKFLSPTSASVSQQEEWIKKYKLREKEKKEFYFIVKNKETGEKCGTVRIYDIQEKEATWGSFILDKNRPNGASYEVIENTLQFAFDELKLEKIHLDVRKENEKAIYIYEKSGFVRNREDEENYYYEIK